MFLQSSDVITVCINNICTEFNLINHILWIYLLFLAQLMMVWDCSQILLWWLFCKKWVPHTRNFLCKCVFISTLTVIGHNLVLLGSFRGILSPSLVSFRTFWINRHNPSCIKGQNEAGTNLSGLKDKKKKLLSVFSWLVGLIEMFGRIFSHCCIRFCTSVAAVSDVVLLLSDSYGPWDGSVQ